MGGFIELCSMCHRQVPLRDGRCSQCHNAPARLRELEEELRVLRAKTQNDNLKEYMAAKARELASKRPPEKILKPQWVEEYMEFLFAKGTLDCGMFGDGWVGRVNSEIVKLRKEKKELSIDVDELRKELDLLKRKRFEEDKAIYDLVDRNAERERASKPWWKFRQ